MTIFIPSLKAGDWTCFVDKMFKGIDFKDFLNDWREWHALVEGFCETFCFWRANYEPSKELLEDLKSEHHYYVFGRVLGFISLVGLGLLAIRILRGKAKDGI